MKPFRFKIQKRSIKVDLPSFPQQSSDKEPEYLTGMVQGKQASAPEERMANALDKFGVQYIFRYVVGAPKGMPGWKELDFLISSDGQLHPVEVDTAFTHRDKQQSDRLHDAIILNDRTIRMMGDVYPRVDHVSGDSDLSTQELADKYVGRFYSNNLPAVPRTPDYIPYYPATVQQAIPKQNPSPAPAGTVNKSKPKQYVNKKVFTRRPVGKRRNNGKA